MPSPPTISTLSTSLLTPHNLRLTSHTTLQSLWAGYGSISRLHVAPIDPASASASGSESPLPSTLILKLVSPPPSSTSTTPTESHLRKILSYHVELYFYTHLAPLLPSSAAVARVFTSSSSSSSSDDDTIALLLTDLRTNFPVAGEKRGVLSKKQVHAALGWLGTFHGFWWGEAGRRTLEEGKGRDRMRRAPAEEWGRKQGKGVGVWLNGGYTYLATRRTEYANLAQDTDSEWSAILCTPDSSGLSLAEKVAKILEPAKKANAKTAMSEFETLIHGDVKSENLFTTEDEDAVAFFDFQYVGLGLGVSDLAKLFTCSVPEGLLTEQAVGQGERRSMQDGEKKLLQQYLRILCEVSEQLYEWEAFVRHWETALVDWLRFQASWGFWGNTEWLEARVRYIVDDRAWRAWIDENSGN